MDFGWMFDGFFALQALTVRYLLANLHIDHHSQNDDQTDAKTTLGWLLMDFGWILIDIEWLFDGFWMAFDGFQMEMDCFYILVDFGTMFGFISMDFEWLLGLILDGCLMLLDGFGWIWDRF